MGIIGSSLGYHVLRLISPEGSRTGCSGGNQYEGESKLDVLFGRDIWRDINNKTVVDFGCGRGNEVIEIAAGGARQAIGVDIRQSVLNEASHHADQAGVSKRCTFTKEYNGKADVIVSCDAFEHFDEPTQILDSMAKILSPNGAVWISFGPPWYHPHGGHLFSVFPWAHLIFTERALIRWRSDFKTDGATRFGEVEGGLNKMTIRRFKKLVHASPLKFNRIEAVPIRRLRWFSNAITQEFFTSIVRCRLVHK